MRQQESCEGACRERRLEFVSGSDYDELSAAAATCRDRIEGFGAVVGVSTSTKTGTTSQSNPWDLWLDRGALC
jgi:hypothetical protein